jgi:N-acetyl-gamma-glutamyl-phosphate reductase
MISVGIIGGSGYLGKKLIQFCENHPFVDEYEVYGFSTSGECLFSISPELFKTTFDKKIKNISALSLNHDLYFVSLPHGESFKVIPSLLGNGKKVIDLSGDYRLNKSELYSEWYGIKHLFPHLLSHKIYGLADVIKNETYTSNLISNPGCYATAALLSIIPILDGYNEKIISISVNGYSGSSGAGKSLKVDLLLSELEGNVTAYNVHKHRHEPEILQELTTRGFNSHFTFSTHLLPIAIGIYSTSTIHLSSDVEQNEIEEAYNNFYGDAQFVRLRNTPPQLKWVVGSNFCDLNISTRKNSIIITAAIDNLIKGGAGQAIQNMNKLFNWDQAIGIIPNGVKYAQLYK